MHNDSMSCIVKWLSYADFYLFPNVYTFNNMSDYIQVVNSVLNRTNSDLIEESKQSRLWASHIINGTIFNLNNVLI